MQHSALSLLADATIVRIGDREFALQAWGEQLGADEMVYSGYDRADWDAAAPPSAIVKELRDGRWLWCDDGAYQPQFHDDGGLRIVGYWHGGPCSVVGDAYQLWQN